MAFTAAGVEFAGSADFVLPQPATSSNVAARVIGSAAAFANFI
jgi:hypothetical protein